MAQIGSFTRGDDGVFTGMIRTLNINTKAIIRPVAKDEATVTFQFTQESRAGDKYEYTLETMLALEKATGKVKCALPGLAVPGWHRPATGGRSGSQGSAAPPCPAPAPGARGRWPG